MLLPGAEAYPEQKKEKGDVDLESRSAKFPYGQ
jgi:hypothetical protein